MSNKFKTGIDPVEVMYKDDNAGGATLAIGSSAPDLVAFNGGTILTRAFDGNATSEQLFWGREINHDYAEGGDIQVHLHWCPTTANSGNVEWFVDYTIDRNNVGNLASGTLSVVDSADGTAWTPTVVEIGTIDGTNFKLGDQCAFRLYRVPNGTNDTYPDDAAIAHTFGYHYPINSVGSRQIITK